MIFRSYLFVILTCVQILCPLLIMAGSFSSSQDIEAEIFFRASICVRKAKKKVLNVVTLEHVDCYLCSRNSV